LDIGFFQVAGAESGFGMNTGDAHKIHIGANVLYSVDSRRAHRDNRVFEQPASDEDHFDAGMIDQFNGGSGAVGHDGGLEMAGQVAGNLNSCRAAIEYDDLPFLYKLRRRSSDGDFGFGLD